MRSLAVGGIAIGLLFLAGGAAAFFELPSQSKPQGSSPRKIALSNARPATPLALRELLDPGPKLQPSSKARSLEGQRVRIAGFMAKMEEPLKGSFYLVPRPMSLDESGAGTGDLPLEAVLVLVRGSENETIPHLPGALEGIGILEIGNHADPDGRVSNFRLRLDPDQRWAAAH